VREDSRFCNLAIVNVGSLVFPPHDLDPTVYPSLVGSRHPTLGGLGHGRDLVDENVVQEVFGDTAEISKPLDGDPTFFVSQEFANQNL
jgi:hypothetical protein